MAYLQLNPVALGNFLLAAGFAMNTEADNQVIVTGVSVKPRVLLNHSVLRRITPGIGTHVRQLDVATIIGSIPTLIVEGRAAWRIAILNEWEKINPVRTLVSVNVCGEITIF
ncbi:hypothetical protein [Rubidibacter lacunae]|uniref:hypothetical protein n=1 Tax=Rubidibacter lacunae TaxID=582514 RepID=UPI001E4E0D4B|nr:hypothetical protein [Rubidibacter lacunae]